MRMYEWWQRFLLSFFTLPYSLLAVLIYLFREGTHGGINAKRALATLPLHSSPRLFTNISTRTGGKRDVTCYDRDKKAIELEINRFKCIPFHFIYVLISLLPFFNCHFRFTHRPVFDLSRCLIPKNVIACVSWMMINTDKMSQSILKRNM